MHDYFITAYGIAIKHGFVGSEEEWLQYLTAFSCARRGGFTGTFEEWAQMLAEPVPVFKVGTVTTLPGGSEATVSLGGDRMKPVLNFGIPRGLGAMDALPLVGGFMKGPIHMNNFALDGLRDPESDSDAVPLRFFSLLETTLQNELSSVSTVASNALNIAGNAAGIASNAASDAANVQESADAKASRLPTITVVLPVSNWVGSSAPYTQTVQVEGILETDEPHYGLVFSGTTEQKLAQKEAFACVDDLDTAENSVTFTCFTDKPETDLTIQMEVIR